MLNKPLEQINLADLQELVADKVQEGKAIEYKQAMYRLDSPDSSDRDKQREELLKDVSSFANTIGGHLIIGIVEENSVAAEVFGVPLASHDMEINRLHQLIGQWLEPRVSCDIRAVEKEAGRYVLVLRVPRSLVSPHRVVYQRQFGQFWARNSKGAYAMDTSELRRAFTLSESIYEQIKQFRKDRVGLVRNGETPVPLRNTPALALHLLPLDSFSTQLSLRVGDLESQVTSLRPLMKSRAGSSSHRINLDGVVAHWGGAATEDAPNRSYTQAFRNGIIEAAVCDIVGTENSVRFLRIEEIESQLCRGLGDYLGCLRSVGVQPPIWCFITLTEMKGVHIADRSARASGSPPNPPIDREVLYLPETLIENLSTEPAVILQPLLDMIWNAAGYEAGPDSRSDGALQTEQA